MPNVSPEHQKALNNYAALMVELRARVQAIPRFADPDIDLPAPTRGESCFLQLRLICELIALGCLVAHGDLKEVKAARMQKAYEADYIIKRLEKLHPDFYPVPHDVETFAGPTPELSAYHYTPIERDFLTKDDLLKLYRRSGSVLHRGSLHALGRRPRDEAELLGEVNAAHSRIIRLTAQHHLMTMGREFVFVCSIPAEEHGSVHVALGGAQIQNSPGRNDLLIVGPTVF